MAFRIEKWSMIGASVNSRHHVAPQHVFENSGCAQDIIQPVLDGSSSECPLIFGIKDRLCERVRPYKTMRTTPTKKLLASAIPGRKRSLTDDTVIVILCACSYLCVEVSTCDAVFT